MQRGFSQLINWRKFALCQTDWPVTVIQILATGNTSAYNDGSKDANENDKLHTFAKLEAKKYQVVILLR
jgi:hypothetical protein